MHLLIHFLHALYHSLYNFLRFTLYFFPAVQRSQCAVRPMVSCNGPDKIILRRHIAGIIVTRHLLDHYHTDVLVANRIYHCEIKFRWVQCDSDD